MTRRLPWVIPACVTVCLLIATGPAAAQSPESVRLEGRVVLTDGTPVEKALVEAISVEGHRDFKVKTRKDGTFRIPFARFGTYTFKVTKDDLVMYSLAVEILDSRKVVIDRREGRIPEDQRVPEYQIAPFHGGRFEFVMAAPGEIETAAGVVVEDDTGSLLADANELHRAGRFDESDAALAKLLADEPDNATAHYLAGLNAMKRGEPAQARPRFEKANALDPLMSGPASQVAMIANEAGDAAAAIDWFEKELVASPDELAIHINLAVLLSQAGRDEEAIAKFEEVIALDPNERGAYQELADLYTRAGNDRKAAETLERMEAVGEPDPKYWFNVGANLANKGENEKAEDAFRKALAIDPSFPEAHREIGYMCVRRGDMKGAREHLEKYLELKPDAGDAAEIRDMVETIIAQQ